MKLNYDQIYEKVKSYKKKLQIFVNVLGRQNFRPLTKASKAKAKATNY